MSASLIEKLVGNLNDKLEYFAKVNEVLDSQAEMLENPELNEGIFDNTMEELDTYFSELERLDVEFDDIFEGIKIMPNKEELSAKYGIANLSDKVDEYISIIRPKMEKSRVGVEKYLRLQRSDVGAQKKSVAGIGGYFKSMGALGRESVTKEYKI